VRLDLLTETSSHVLTLRSHVGLRLPMHANALVNCPLAQLDDDDAPSAAGRALCKTLTARTASLAGREATASRAADLRATAAAISGTTA
jgi:DNA-binding IclR family transcriptional regulator